MKLLGIDGFYPTVVLASLAAFSTLPSAFGALIDVTRSGSPSAIGDPVSVTLSISGLTGAALDSLGGFDVDFTFNSVALQFVGSSFIDPISSRNELDLPGPIVPFSGGVAPAGVGRLDVFGLSGNSTATLDTLQAGGFALIRLDFQLLSLASSTVGIDLADPNLLFLDSGAGVLPTQFGASSVSITPTAASVPEASAGLILPMMLSSLLALLRVRHPSVRPAETA